jgi:hypothetical protein
MAVTSAYFNPGFPPVSSFFSILVEVFPHFLQILIKTNVVMLKGQQVKGG